MSLYEFAKDELELLDWIDDKEIYEGLLSKSVLQLIKLFEKQGHSGASAAVTLAVFNNLAKYQPLSELTNNPKEWCDQSDMNDGRILFQSRRNSSCFSVDKLIHYYDIYSKRLPKWKRHFIKNHMGYRLHKLPYHKTEVKL